ncbi:signal transduction histidine kinase [Chitinophaga polysaccharea]|uniref:histidine kinase n=1 Tax=Chitinophaga polysaccharea TaxID=1293035 RepID=A0A561P757_9BACT|nr:hybrid sensor histidine kinase/response regulator [Chitinophaga polysaccharea]TWF33918.1 signal transduction histidine kinase [Chitinophaga polysaccharea]
MKIIERLKTVFRKITKTGTEGVNDDELVARIKLVNTLSLVLATLIFIVGTTFIIITPQLSIIIPSSIEFFATLFTIYLNHKRRYWAAAASTFLIQCVASVYFGILLSNIIELQAMIIFLISIIYLIFQDRPTRRVALVVAICILTMLETYYHYHLVSTIPLNIHAAYIFRLSAMFGVLTLIIVVSRPYIHSNDFNKQLKRSNHFKKIFVYQVTHELRTPLNAIYGVAQLLKREIKLDENLKSIELLIDQLLLASNHTRNIVNDVLDMAQIESGNTETTSNEAFEITPFIEKLVDVSRVIAKSRNIKIKLSISEMPQVIIGDALKLNQVATNLLGNAIKYSDKGSTINCYITGNQTTWSLHIVNMGNHIPEEKLKTIFDPFTTDKRKYTEGAGLGLYIVQNKVNSMNGTITAESSPSGINSFKVVLPLTAGSLEDIQLDILEEDAIIDLSDIHVIVAEDNEMSAMLVSRFLKQIGCSVCLTANGSEVLEACQKRIPDIIIMDYHMDIMDGKDTLIRLKRNPLLKKIPVIIATGDAFLESRDQMIAAGASAFVEKPLDYKSLVKILNQQLHPLSGELQE